MFCLEADALDKTRFKKLFRHKAFRPKRCLQLHLTDFFIKSFCEIQFLHKYINVSFIITNIKFKLTYLCGNGLLQKRRFEHFL